MSKAIEETVERILSLIGEIRAKEEKAVRLNRKEPIPLCEIIDETVDGPKPRGCVFCIPHLPRDHASACGCQIIDESEGE